MGFLSVELRKRVVAAVREEGMNCRAAARWFGEERGGGYDKPHATMQPVPGSRFAMVEAEIAFGALETFLDRPALKAHCPEPRRADRPPIGNCVQEATA